ncbi:hypothetical protein GGI25_004671 [Coemansia spiralis]|uniref:Protein kinase domain-containing protein n=1 Tax=Coemansia spiralis TaxID=417178 RepID=A0A9W8G555_9FUNG|nr:hypothetical protein GGI25_004671 [Coemansia spiralis]
MESKYKSIKHIGEGAFSSVILALNAESGEKVAIKKMKKRRWKDTAAQAEIGALQKLHHENIIRLLDVFREDYRSFLVFECMDCDLNELVVSRNGRRLPETVILDITYQVLNGLDYIHANDLFHRDIKPENVLIRRHIMSGGPGDSSTIVVEAKIADFGLVHDMDFSRPLTDYISTRWYRAPEVLLNCSNYSTPIDVWAVGTIVSELATLRPLFPGTNQIDQLRRIFEVLGTPRISAPTPGAGGFTDDDDDYSIVDKSDDSWYEGAVHARKLGIAFVPSVRKPLEPVMPGVASNLVKLVDYILVLNPSARPTAKDALNLVSKMLDQTLGVPQAEDADDMQVPSSTAPSTQEDMAEESANVSPRSKLGICSMELDPQMVPTSASFKSSGGKRDSGKEAEPPMAAAAAADDGTNAHGQKKIQRIPPIVSKSRANTEPDAAKDANGTDFNGKQQSAVQKEEQLLEPKPAAASVHDGRISFTPRDQMLLKQSQLQRLRTDDQPSPLREEVTDETQQRTAQAISADEGVADSGSPITMRTSTEINIVQELHKEPLRDPRGDLSEFAVKPVHTGMAHRIVLPHMRATTPVSASVPAPQITPRISNQAMQPADWSPTSIDGQQTPVSTDKRRMGVNQANAARVNNLRVRSQTVSSVSSIGSNATRSVVMSPASSSMQMSQLSPTSVDFSDTSELASSRDMSKEEPSDGKHGLRIYAEIRPAVPRNSSLMSILAQQQQPSDYGRVEALILKSAANAASTTQSNQTSSTSSSGSGHIRKAPGIVDISRKDDEKGQGSVVKRKSNSTGMREMAIEGFIPLRSLEQQQQQQQQPATISAGMTRATSRLPVVPISAAESQHSADVSQLQGQQSGGKQARVLGLRSKNGIGSPLIRRALSMRKRGPKESQKGENSDDISQFAFAVHTSPPVPKKALPKMSKKQQEALLSEDYAVVAVENGSPSSAHLLKRSKSELVMKQMDEACRLTGSNEVSINESVAESLLSDSDSSVGQLNLSAEMQALAESINLDSLDAPSSTAGSSNRGKKEEWIANIQFLRQRLADNNISVGDVSITDKHREGGRRSSVGDAQPDIKDRLGVRSPGQPTLKAGIVQPSEADDNVTRDIIAGLDSFAPVTFDVGALFRQSILENVQEKTPNSPYYPDSLQSPEYMATFSEVRRKYSSPKPPESVLKPGTVAEVGSHRFLSKVKNAFTGGRHNHSRQASSGQPHASRARANSRGKGETNTLSKANDGALPRLDVDLGNSLLTPDSIHRGAHDTLVSHTSPFPKLDVGSGPSGAESNDAYYLIDYINSQQESKPGTEPTSTLSANIGIPAARRVLNKSTRARQTQYEYNFGSQIFECFDKDFLLLKTDAFKDNVRLESSEEPKASKQRRGKKPVDATAATAYTAAAINSIVAHNAKARNTNIPSMGVTG